MASFNNSTEAIAVREVHNFSSISEEILLGVRLFVVICSLVVNGGIVLFFLIQKIRRPTAVSVSPAGLLVINLLLADAMVAFISIVNIATTFNNLTAWAYWCSARLGLSYLVMIGSHIALINVAIDRYIAIIYTLRYRDFMTMVRSLTMVAMGWVIPLAGLIGVIAANDWVPGLQRCAQMTSFRLFLVYVWVPSHILALLCVIIIQCRVYLELRRHDRRNLGSNQILRRFSQKSAKILFRVTTTFVLCWGPFDLCLVMIASWPSPMLKTIYDVTLIFAQLSFLVNPVIYSYQTANIRKPVSDLFSDIKKCLWEGQLASHTSDGIHTIDVSPIRTISSFHKSASSSSMQTRSSSVTSIGYI